MRRNANTIVVMVAIAMACAASLAEEMPEPIARLLREGEAERAEWLEMTTSYVARLEAFAKKVDAARFDRDQQEFVTTDKRGRLVFRNREERDEARQITADAIRATTKIVKDLEACKGRAAPPFILAPDSVGVARDGFRVAQVIDERTALAMCAGKFIRVEGVSTENIVDGSFIGDGLAFHTAGTTSYVNALGSTSTVFVVRALDTGKWCGGKLKCPSAWSDAWSMMMRSRPSWMPN